MKQLTKLDNQSDLTAWELHRAKGGNAKDYFSMHLTILLAIPAFVYCAATVGDPFMHHIETGLPVTVGIFYAFWQLLKELDRRFK